MNKLEQVFESSPSKSNYEILEVPQSPKPNIGLLVSLVIIAIVSSFALNTVTGNSLLGVLFLIAFQAPSVLPTFFYHKHTCTVFVPICMVVSYACGSMYLYLGMLTQPDPISIVVLQIYSIILFSCLVFLEFLYLGSKSQLAKMRQRIRNRSNVIL
jgi:hypothetical protein